MDEHKQMWNVEEDRALTKEDFLELVRVVGESKPPSPITEIPVSPYAIINKQ